MTRFVPRVLPALAVLIGLSVAAAPALAQQPVISDIAPTGGPAAGGQSLTIAGYNFGQSPSATVGGRACTTQVSGNYSVTCLTPPGAPGTKAPVMVIAGPYNTTANVLYAYDPPTVASITPNKGPTTGGVLLTISGSSFGAPPIAPVATVLIGGAVCPLVSQTDAQIVCQQPSGVGTGLPVVVNVGAAQSNTNVTFSYNAPTITNVSPGGGPAAGGNTLTISGVNFGPSPTATVGGQPCTNQFPGNSSVNCLAPPGPPGAKVPVVVYAGGQSSNSSSFVTYAYDPPTVLSVTPNTGPTQGGVTLTVLGSNFGVPPIAAPATVTVGATNCPLLGQPDGFDDPVSAASRNGNGLARRRDGWGGAVEPDRDLQLRRAADHGH